MRQPGPERRKTGRLGLAEHQLLVDFVAQHRQIGCQNRVGQRFQLAAGVNRAGRIARRVQHKQPGAWPQSASKLSGRHLEAAFMRGPNQSRLGAGHFGQVAIAHPIGSRDNDLVTGTDRGRQGVVNRMLGAVGDDHLLGRAVQAVGFLIPAGNFLAQFQLTRNHFTMFGFPLLIA